MTEKIQPFVAAARDYVKRAIGADLDGSDTSLAFVDHYIKQSGTLSDAVLALVAPAIGAYFGEVAIAHLGGRWIIASDEPAAWRVELARASLHFSPVGMAACALRGADLEGFDGNFHADPRFADALEEALASAPPIDEEYYYSLTGRLETLEQVQQLLVELDRLARERN